MRSCCVTVMVTGVPGHPVAKVRLALGQLLLDPQQGEAAFWLFLVSGRLRLFSVTRSSPCGLYPSGTPVFPLTLLLPAPQGAPSARTPLDLICLGVFPTCYGRRPLSL